MCDGRCGLVADGSVPVELPAEAGISRRLFISRSTLAAVAAVLTSACGDGIIGGRSPTALASIPATGLTLNLASYPALANVGGIARADTVAGPIALVRTAVDGFSAFSMICPHQGTTIDIVGSGFRCPNHGAQFSAAGQWIGGQATSSLAAFPVSFDAASGLLTVGAGAGPVTPQNPGSTQAPGATTVNLVVDLAAFPALAAVGGVARVDGGTGAPVGAARIAATQFVAYALTCTHQGSTINLTGSGWTCPNHGAQFDALGNVTRGPATSALAPLNTAYDAAADSLTITGTASVPGRGRGDDGDD